MKGKRKLFIVALFGSFCFTAFFFTTRDVSFYTALVGALIGLAGWYNQSNIQKHKIDNGKENNAEK